MVPADTPESARPKVMSAVNELPPVSWPVVVSTWRVFSTLSAFRLVKLASSSVIVSAEPLPPRVTILVIVYSPRSQKRLRDRHVPGDGQ